MKWLLEIVLLHFGLLGTVPVLAAPFQNLQFESVVLSLVPVPGDPFLRVPITNALPAWHGYYAGSEQTSVFYTTATAGASYLALYDRNVGFPTLEDNYSVLLGPSPMSNVSLSQSGHVPDDAQSLRFLGLVGYAFGPPMPLNSLVGVFVNSQQLQITDAFSEAGVYNYSADISTFAGQDITLTFTSFNLQYPNSLLLDSISFSTTPIPEPSAFALFGISIALGWFVWGANRDKRGLAFTALVPGHAPTPD